MTIEIVDFPIEHGDSNHSLLVYQRVPSGKTFTENELERSTMLFDWENKLTNFDRAIFSHLSGPLAPLIPKVCIAPHGHLQIDLWNLWNLCSKIILMAQKIMGKSWENAVHSGFQHQRC